jgi:hypothetical protein
MGVMMLKPPPLEKKEMSLLEATTSVPPLAHCSVDLQMGALKFEPVLPPASSVAPTAVRKGEAAG